MRGARRTLAGARAGTPGSMRGCALIWVVRTIARASGVFCGVAEKPGGGRRKSTLGVVDVCAGAWGGEWGAEAPIDVQPKEPCTVPPALATADDIAEVADAPIPPAVGDIGLGRASCPSCASIDAGDIELLPPYRSVPMAETAVDATIGSDI